VAYFLGHPVGRTSTASTINLSSDWHMGKTASTSTTLLITGESGLTVSLHNQRGSFTASDWSDNGDL